MIENFLMKDQFTYSLVIGTIIISVTAGYFLGHQPPEQICSEYIIENDELKDKASDLNAELTKAKAKCIASDVVTNCNKVCDERVKKALKDYKDIVCED
jgi:hypothetical protein